MLLDLMEHWSVDIERSFIIGDKPSDLQAGQRAGVGGYLFDHGNLAAFIDTLLTNQHTPGQSHA